jgi:hypothetical protein
MPGGTSVEKEDLFVGSFKLSGAAVFDRKLSDVPLEGHHLVVNTVIPLSDQNCWKSCSVMLTNPWRCGENTQQESGSF